MRKVSATTFHTLLFPPKYGCAYLRVWRKLQVEDVVTYRELTHVVTNEFGGWTEFEAEIKTSDYQTDITKVWESVVALNICLGYRHALAQQLIIVLIVGQALDLASAYAATDPDDAAPDDAAPDEADPDEADPEEAGPEAAPDAEAQTSGEETTPLLPTVVEIETWLRATVVLPADIFPLPPQSASGTQAASGTQDAAAAAATSWITPYAIGSVRSVQHELIGYELGEIQKIENILQGEVRESSNRQLKRRASETHEALDEADERFDDAGVSTGDLITQVQKTLMERTSTTTINDYKTDYGMPTSQTMTASGGWTVDEKPAGGSDRDISKFARDVVDKTVKRISRQVQRTRTQMEFEENEITDTSKFDNVAGADNIRGIYRWVNKSYSVYSRVLENRLVLEIMLDDPAAYFVENLRRYFDIDLVPPVTPASLGVTGYADVSALPADAGDDDDQTTADAGDDDQTTAGADSATYYLDLFEQFGVTDPLPPPSAEIMIGGVVKSRNPLSEASLDVPPGYTAGKANLSGAGFTKATQTAIVGATSITIPTTSPGEDLPNLTGTVPISILSISASGGQGNADAADDDKGGDTTDDSAEFDTYYVVNIELACTPSDEHMADWQYRAYQKICAGYEKQLAAYTVALKAQRQVVEATNPSFLEDTINNQIIQGCLSQLYAQYLSEIGSPASGDGGASGDDAGPDQQTIGRPRYFEYCRSSLSWSDLDCQLYYGDAADQIMEEGQGALLRAFSPDLHFRNFLRASSARILLPVAAGRARSFLLFLNSGAMWPDQERFTPCLEDDIDIVNRIKLGALTAPDALEIEATWRIKVPTSMSMLAQGHFFPDFGAAE